MPSRPYNSWRRAVVGPAIQKVAQLGGRVTRKWPEKGLSESQVPITFLAPLFWVLAPLRRSIPCRQDRHKGCTTSPYHCWNDSPRHTHSGAIIPAVVRRSRAAFVPILTAR